MKPLLAAAILVGTAAAARAAWRADRYAADAACPHDALRTTRPEPRNSWLPGISPGWPLATGRWTLTWKGTF